MPRSTAAANSSRSHFIPDDLRGGVVRRGPDLGQSFILAGLGDGRNGIWRQKWASGGGQFHPAAADESAKWRFSSFGAFVSLGGLGGSVHSFQRAQRFTATAGIVQRAVPG